MKPIRVISSLVLFLAIAAPAVAQEHWTEGPVWIISYYRTRPGQFDNYMKYLRANVLPQNAEAKRQGLVLDDKMYVKAPSGKDDWDVAFATLHPSAAKALDFNKADDDKQRAIAAQHYKTTDRDKQTQSSAPRLEMRDFIRTEIVREISLRPMP